MHAPISTQGSAQSSFLSSCTDTTGIDLMPPSAQPWYERAVAAEEHGDVHGRVDHESHGSSLHQVGYCLASTGQFAAARPWYERAVAAAEQGDVHGRVDHSSLATSLRAGAACLTQLGRHEEAAAWEKRASDLS